MIADPPQEQLFVVRQMMLNMDPPQHTKLRALVNKGFTPRRWHSLQARIGALARGDRRSRRAARAVRLRRPTSPASCPRTSSPS